MDLREQIGQRLVIGFPGTELDPEFKRLVKEYKIGNIILFQRNLKSMEQVKALCADIQELVRRETGHDAFITIDQEGGKVTRLPGDGCNVPGAMATAATGEVENAEILAHITAKELKAVGVNFNLAPCMDINNNPENPVIGVRSYGDTAETVAAYGTAAFRGYRKGGVLSCAKHFPGHGDTAVDSHVGLPVIDKTMEELEALELKPFRAAMEAGIPAVMGSHILFPKLEPDNVPCTMSRRIVTGVLKDRLGFPGLVVSDCMEMDAIKKYYGTVKGVVSAMAAGVDMVLVCHTAALQEESARAVLQAVEEGRLSGEEMRISAEKVVRLKEEYAKSADAEAPCRCTEEDRALEREIRRKSIVVMAGDGLRSGEPEREKPGKGAAAQGGGSQGSVGPERQNSGECPAAMGPVVLGTAPFFTGSGSYRATLAFNDEELSETFAAHMAARLGGTHFDVGADPKEEEIGEAVERARGASGIVVSLFAAREQAGQYRLVEALSGLGVPVIAVALYSPYDLKDLPEGVTGIAAWDNTPMTLQALEELFRGEWQPTGRMPVKL